MSFPLPFAKYEALGNDFVLVDARTEPDLAGDWPLARALLDRHFGAGADDAIFVLPSEVADVRMRIRTPSGGWLSMCGNGIRCLARFVWDSGISAADPLRVETDAGVREVRLLDRDADLTEVDLLVPDTRAASIPTHLAGSSQTVIDVPLDLGALGAVSVSCVSVGNPHAVFFVEELDATPMDQFGPAIEHHQAFPQGVNAHAAQVLAPDRAVIRTWERGAGLTLAWGTGAAATVVAGVLTGRMGGSATVETPGGPLEVQWDQASGHVRLASPAVAVYRGVLAQQPPLPR